MTNNEKELLNIIRQHSNHTQALKTAMELMIDFLTNYEEPQGTSSVLRQEAS